MSLAIAARELAVEFQILEYPTFQTFHNIPPNLLEEPAFYFFFLSLGHSRLHRRDRVALSRWLTTKGRWLHGRKASLWVRPTATFVARVSQIGIGAYMQV